MANKINPSFTIRAGGAWSYLARIKNPITGADVTQAALSSISRVVTNKVTGGVTTTAITVSAAVYDTLQTNTDLWSQTYNFKDDVAYSIVTERVRHTLQYTLTYANGQVTKTEEVDIEGD